MTDHGGFSSSAYWEARYQAGGASGAGSYGRLAAFKAELINAFVADNRITSALDLGCGDGNLLSQLRLPNYVGMDPSPAALARCATRFADRHDCRFVTPAQLDDVQPVDLAMSIDVVFHLVEDAVFERHMRDLFASATRFVLIYASNFDGTWPDRHVRHRRFSDYVAACRPDWHLLAHVPNRFPYHPARPGDTSFADFFVYGRTPEPCVIRLPAGSREHPAQAA
jgi:SAM-dependent methyltransferase